jgi:glutamyl/glutaminyl-tRNA synthetase
MTVVSRLAPTPNGEIHWGNLMNFALTWAHVRQAGGKLWLRFDDIDQDRCADQYAEGIRHVLDHLGLNWDAEYSRQIRFVENYRQFLGELPHYVCECSRQDIHRRTGDYHYDGSCREKNLTYQAGRHAIRFLNPRAPEGDFILWRRENIPAYHLTSLYDDITMGVNLIVRGEDLLESSLIQQEISRTIPDDPLSKVVFIHHHLLTTPEGEKLAKSRQDGDLMTLLKQGMTAREMWKRLAKLMNLSQPLLSSNDLLSLKLSM